VSTGSTAMPGARVTSPPVAASAPFSPSVTTAHGVSRASSRAAAAGSLMPVSSSASRSLTIIARAPLMSGRTPARASASPTVA
jgi:hypothetical protein